MKYLKITLLFILGAIVSSNAQEAELPQNWYHLDARNDNYNGVSEIKAYKELLKNKQSYNIIVAVIDSGVDKDHEDLRNVMWVNLKEIPENGIDDDKNGYIDDINGWNFIGGKDGKNINGETLEITRLCKKYDNKYKNAVEHELNKKDLAEYKIYLDYKKKVSEEYDKAKAQLDQLTSTKPALINFANILDSNIPGDIISNIGIDSIKSDDQQIQVACQVGKNFLLQWGDSTTLEALSENIALALDEGIHYYGDKANYQYNMDYNGRAEIVGDNPNDLEESNYGNNDVVGPDALHGTHVAGIIGAQRGNSIGMDGIADNISIMSIRTVPNGDERDKDVANAIRYAVDNGASIINMSFGKGHSWNKDIVDKAVRYAEKRDVLLIHAAGNSAQDNDVANNFPNDSYRKIGCLFWKKKRAKNWIEVGALSYEKDSSLVAGFSNYGKNNVDVFAPGMKIYSTIPDNKYKNLQGTSMAAPVVAGIAAVLRSYFPTLTAKQVKSIIMDSAVKKDQIVLIPGTDAKTTSFSKLSISGGITNLFEAIKLAQKTKGKKKLKKRKNNNA